MKPIHTIASMKSTTADAARREAVAPLAERRVSFQVHRVNAKLAQVANVLFRERKLDLISSRILVFLLERKEMRVGELASLMVLPQSTISYQVQRLAKRGLLRRRRAREDNRAAAISLTKTGAQVASECNALSLSIYRHMIQELEVADIERLRALLGKLFAALESFGSASQKR
jgi:DNA-binding MarR family transcriptional regulator